MTPGYHWFVAWRYLMVRPRRASRVIAVVAAALAAVVAASVCLAVFAFGDVEVVRGIEVEHPWRRAAEMTAIGAGALLELVLVLGVIRYVFTFFTTVSIGGVTIGTMALVIVLSVMSGFESDLREKILGSNAHLRVTRADEEPFGEYAPLLEAVEKVPEVVAATPYLTSEVIIGASSTYGNVIIKGVDPITVAEVTELRQNIEDDDDTLMRLWPLAEDGSIAGPGGAEPEPEPEPRPPSRGARPDAGVEHQGSAPARGVGEAGEEIDPEPVIVDPAPPDIALPDEPIDFSGDDEEDPFDVEDLERRIEAIEKPAAGWPDAFVGKTYAGPRRHSSSPRINLLEGVLVGRELVKNLHLYTGQEVSLVSPLGQMTPAGPAPRSKPYRVAGGFYTGMYEYDTKWIYVELGSLQRFLSEGDVVHGIEIRVRDRDDTDGVKAAVARALPPGFLVEDWKQINANLFTALELEKIAMFLVLAVIILVASFSIVGNLIMVVVEKAREIALLKTLGSPDRGIMKIFVVQGLVIGAVGTALGVANGLVACWLGKTWGLPLNPDVYYIDRLPIHVEWGSVAAVAAAGVLISVLATLYPAYVGARVEPVEGLRYE